MMLTGTLWALCGDIPAQDAPRFFWPIGPMRVWHEPDTFLASGLPKGVPLPRGVKNGNSR